MSRRPHHGLAALALIAAAPAALTAQSGSGDGFLFGAPRPLETVKAELLAVTLAELNGYLAARPEPRFTVLTLGPEALEYAPAGAEVL